MPSTRPQIYRLMVIDREIRAGRFPNSVRLSEALEVSGRTIQRDLETLRDALGAPLEFDPVRNGYLYREKSFALPAQRLTEGDLLTLLTADAALAEVRGTSLETTLRQILDKLPAVLPEEILVTPRELGRIAETPVAAPAHCDPGVFLAMQEAIRDQAELEVTYHLSSGNETKQRRLDPYRLVNLDGGWVLLAYSHEHGDLRTFHPARIEAVRRTGESFRRPTGFDPAAYLATHFQALAVDKPVEVHLRFEPALAPALAEHDWPEGSRCQFTTDGGVDLTLVTENIDALLRWTLGWGAGAQVLSPPWIRRRMRETVRRVLQRYQARTVRPARTGRSAGSSRKVFKPPSRGRRPRD